MKGINKYYILSFIIAFVSFISMKFLNKILAFLKRLFYVEKRVVLKIDFLNNRRESFLYFLSNYFQNKFLSSKIKNRIIIYKQCL